MSGLPPTLPAPATGYFMFADLPNKLAHPEPVHQWAPWLAAPCTHLPPNSPCFLWLEQPSSCSGVPSLSVFPWLFTRANGLRTEISHPCRGVPRAPATAQGLEGPRGPTLLKQSRVFAGRGHPAAFVPSTLAGVACKRLCLPKGAALSNLCSWTVPLFHLTQRVTLTRHLLPFARNTRALRPYSMLEGTWSAPLAHLELGLPTHPYEPRAVIRVIMRSKEPLQGDV